MSLGFDREVDLVSLGDTAEVYAYLYDKEDSPEEPEEVVAVRFTIQRPDDTRETVNGQVGDNGEGYVAYNNADIVGQYRVIASFTLLNGVKRSSRADFEVIDPFNPPLMSKEEVIGTAVWKKLEDCFDAEDEGPWLRDMTLNYFNEWKMKDFISSGLWSLNERQPRTQLTNDYFFTGEGDPTADLPLLAKATFIEVLKHLMRSYVEQPQPMGAQVVYEDRRDYLQRWQIIYQMEKESLDQDSAMFKRRFLGLGHSAILVDTKAGRLLPAPLRTRQTGRGYY